MFVFSILQNDFFFLFLEFLFWVRLHWKRGSQVMVNILSWLLWVLFREFSTQAICVDKLAKKDNACFFSGSIVYFLRFWAIYISIHYGFGLCSLIIARYWAFVRTQCKLLTRTNQNMKIDALNTSDIFNPLKLMLSCLLRHFKKGLTIT